MPEVTTQIEAQGAFPLDSRFIASTIEEALTKVTTNFRYRGLTIFIESINKEYWFQMGITDGDFIEKSYETNLTNYQVLDNLPQLNGVEIVGNKTSSEYGLQEAGEYITAEQFATKQNNLIAGSGITINNDQIAITNIVPQTGFDGRYSVQNFENTPYIIIDDPTINEDEKTISFNGSISYKTASGESKTYVSIADLITTVSATIATPWTQPVLTDAGTWGVSELSCRANSNISSSQYAPWKAFNGIGSAYTDCWYSAIKPTEASPVYLEFYSTLPLRVTKLKITNRVYASARSDITSGAIFASNDGVTYDLLAEFSDNPTGSGVTWEVDLTPTKPYVIYRITAYSGIYGSGQPGVSINNIEVVTGEYSTFDKSDIAIEEGVAKLVNQTLQIEEPTEPEIDLVWYNYSTSVAQIYTGIENGWQPFNGVIIGKFITVQNELAIAQVNYNTWGDIDPYTATITSATKKYIVGELDYSRAESFIVSTDTVSEKEGVLQGWCQTSGTTTATFSINGFDIAREYNTYINLNHKISVGDLLSTTATTQDLILVPYKEI